jgi:MYXO-CTERM domain-containing protein
MYFGQSINPPALPVFPGWVGDILKGIGVTPSIASVVGIAAVNPTPQNIENVQRVYAEAGISPPAQLMNWLISRRDAGSGSGSGGVVVSETNYWPWLAAGAAALLLLRRRR